MILTECEPMYETAFYEDLKPGDTFLFYSDKPIFKNYYTKTDIELPDDENRHWAINIVTGERERFMKNDIVVPVDIELKIKRPKTAEKTCEGCKYINMAAYDDSGPCVKCSRDYEDKYEKKREEG